MLTLAVVWISLCFSNSVLFAQQRRAPQKLEPGSSCLAEQCHASLRSGPVVHGPLAEGDESCELCHEAEGDRHAFSLTSTGAELCYNCHESVTDKKIIHAPLKDDESSCTNCHNPHSSANEKLLNTKTINELCLGCHKEVAEGGMYHDAEKIEGCTDCHQAHSSDRASFLSAKSPELCYTCHGELKDSITQAAMVHGPVSMGCDNCHHAHQKLAGKGLAKAVPEMCVDCHEDFKPMVAQMSSRHHLLVEGKKCAHCHDPHASKGEQLLLDNTQSLCLSCHVKDVKTADGRVIANVKEILDKGVHPHGFGETLDCVACHQPHANEQFRFLRGPYPKKFYSPYSKEIYGLCFTCHDESLAAEAQTDEATEFRSGSTNLHYLHVNKKKKGRTCRACHAWHVSKNAQLLREFVLFAKWQTDRGKWKEWRIPIKFKASENGGACGPGCHRGKAYDRLKSVSYTRPAPVVAPVNPTLVGPPSPTPVGPPASEPVEEGSAPAEQREVVDKDDAGDDRK